MAKDKTLQLRKQVHKLFGDNQVYDDGYQSCYDGKWIDMTDEVCAVADFITADRKRVALEAGIEAAKQYSRVLTDNLPPKPEYTAVGLDGIVSVYRQVEIGEAVRKTNDQCIAELKAQQEEV